ncbi:hypothetical protein [Lignipirellula cremea]|uniref:hypothetical protein n=1 Tax=Lignipirellula cremea TaxID=2528010 RepID=UPI0011A3F142|nr:hypothetical protein [Lignipirellula cremea]
MLIPRKSLPRMACLVVLLGMAVAWAGPTPACAYSPESPEVKAMIAKAVGFLSNYSTPANSLDANGERALIAIALHKADVPDSHPRIKDGIERAVATATKISQKGDRGELDIGSIYAPCLMAILLAEIDPVRYRPQLQIYQNFIHARQKAEGGWTYGRQGSDRGDTSQTQYSVLAMWTLENAGLRSPTERIEGVANWLLRVQSKNGAFQYQPYIPETWMGNDNDATSLTLCGAGMGSIYICCDMLGIASEKLDTGLKLPPALTFVKEEEALQKRTPTGRVPLNVVRNSQAAGARYVAGNWKADSEEWSMYCLYAYERYFSFRELAEGDGNLEPVWYNKGVEHLKKKQTEDGSWTVGSSPHGAQTAFGILFLTRSTKKAIGKAILNEGVMRGGLGLSGDTSQVRMRNGRVVAVPVAKSFDDLMTLLDDPASGELDILASFPDQIEISQDPAQYARNAARLRGFAAHESFEVRLVAMRALAKTGDLDNVPALLYALSDPDWRVVKEARDGLRFMSRNIDGYGLTSKSSAVERKQIENKWRDWYRSIRPDADI